MISALIDLKKNAKPIYGLLAAIFALLPGTAMYFFFAEMGGILYVMLAIPPAIVGFTARFVGRCYTFKHRLPVGLVGAVVHLIGCFLLQLNPFIYLMTPVAFVIALTVAKVKLERVHIWALDQEQLGKLNTNNPSQADA